MMTRYERLTDTRMQNARRVLGMSPRRVITGAPGEWTPTVYVTRPPDVDRTVSAEFIAHMNGIGIDPTPRRAVR